MYDSMASLCGLCQHRPYRHCESTTSTHYDLDDGGVEVGGKNEMQKTRLCNVTKIALKLNFLPKLKGLSQHIKSVPQTNLHCVTWPFSIYDL